MLNMQNKNIDNKTDDSEYEDAELDEINNFKGIYYNEESEQRFYEHNAHFPFKELCFKINRILKTLSPSRRGEDYNKIYNDFKSNNTKNNTVTNVIFFIFLNNY